MLQLAFFLPDSTELMSDYAEKLIQTFVDQPSVDELRPLFPFVGMYCRSNPRAVKRFLNNILLDRAIASRRPGLSSIPMVHFGIARALQLHWPHVADAIRYNDDDICHKLADDFHSQGRSAEA